MSLFDEFIGWIRTAYAFFNSLQCPIIFSDLSWWQVMVSLFFVGTLINLITGEDDEL